MNLAGMLMRAAHRLGDHPALAHGPRTVMGWRGPLPVWPVPCRRWG